MSTVRWGMLSAASIGRVVAAATARSTRARFVAVASRPAATLAGPAGSATSWGALSFGTYEELLACDEVDAIYVPLPISMHTNGGRCRLPAGGQDPLCQRWSAVGVGGFQTSVTA